MNLVIKIFFLSIWLSLAALINYHAYFSTSRSLNNEYLAVQSPVTPADASNKEPISYHFKDPVLAYKVLSLLDVFKPFDSPVRNESRPLLGLRKRDDYCENHRSYVVEFPEVIFEEMNFILTESHESIVRNKVIPALGKDIYPHISSDMPKEQQEAFLYDIKPYVNIFFTKNTMNEHMHIGKHFSCLTQISNHIPLNVKLARKDRLAKFSALYIQQFNDRPQCISSNKLFPKAWILLEKESCEDFFKAFNSPEYQRLKEERKIVYIRKIGASSHKGEGVQPVNQQEEDELRREYDNGKLCGEVKKNYIIQHYINNPLLLHGRKFDFRVYMLIASTNPLITYYHDGSLRVSLLPYDANSNEKQALLTNIALNKQIYKDAKAGTLYEGMDEEALRVSQEWSLERLQAYLLKNGIIKDPNWLDNYLRPEFKKAMIHLMRMSSDIFLKRSSVYELFGMDFMLDEDLNLWFIEANAGPGLEKFSEPVEKFVIKMLMDHFEIVFGLLRSRMKRIVTYVNSLIEDGSVTIGDQGNAIIEDLEYSRMVFENITQNYFEKEFEPQTTNGFFKIIDKNYEGIEAYQGFVTEDCL